MVEYDWVVTERTNLQRRYDERSREMDNWDHEVVDEANIPTSNIITSLQRIHRLACLTVPLKRGRTASNVVLSR
jgi:hypothetical protein